MHECGIHYIFYSAPPTETLLDAVLLTAHAKCPCLLLVTGASQAGQDWRGDRGCQTFNEPLR